MQRYVKCCDELGIKTFILQIESENTIITTNESLYNQKILGYDYVTTGMGESVLYFDLMFKYNTNDEIGKYFKPLVNKLNEYGLFDTLEAIQRYLDVRKALEENGIGDDDEYEDAYPTVVRISRVDLYP